MSATNLADYGVLRQHDLWQVQEGLTALGLSSLGRAEADVAGALARVSGALAVLPADAGAVDTDGPSRARLD